MKKRKIFKKIAALALSAMFLAVSVIPCYPSLTVEAKRNTYPEEVHFPIQILDFPADNLLFEYMVWGSSLSLGTGYVEDDLEKDPVTGLRYPVYKKDKVKEIAENVQSILEGAERGDASQMPVLDSLTYVDADGNTRDNPLSLYTWIKAPYDDVVVLGPNYTKDYQNNTPALPADYVRWTENEVTTHTAAYDGRWPSVYAGTTIDANAKIYSVEYDGLVMTSNKKVSQKFGEIPDGMTKEEFEAMTKQELEDANLVRLKPDTDYVLSYEETLDNNITVKVDNKTVQNGDTIHIDDTGSVKVELTSAATTVGTESNTLVIEGFGDDHANNAPYVISQLDQDATVNWAGCIDNIGFIGPDPYDWRRGKVRFRVYSDQDVTTTMKVYAATGGRHNHYNVTVNSGNAVDLMIPANGNTQSIDNLTTYGQMTINLKKGENVILFEGIGNNRAPILGKLEIDKNNAFLIACPMNASIYSDYHAQYYNHDNGWIRIEGETPTQNAVWEHGHGGADNANCSNGRYENFYDGGDNVYTEYKVYNNEDAGMRTIRFMHALWDQQKSFTISVNGGAAQTVDGFQGDVNKMGLSQVQVRLEKGVNTIRVNLKRGVLDYFEIDTKKVKNKIANIKLSIKGGKYPLGDYDKSKEFYDNPDNADVGYYEGMTCMDYAYFVTSHFFKPHSKLNTVYDPYKEIIFHKVDDDGKISYEFAADNDHKDMDIIYNKNKGLHGGSIRNAFGTDVGNTADGDIIKPGGSMFVVDEITDRPFMDFDRNYQDHNFHYSIVSRSKFVYEKDAEQYFYFSGDDDVYVFVNGHLYMDMGGTHEQQNMDINLDVVAAQHPEYGIEDGKVVDLDLFYMERHTVASNFYSKMNFKLASDNVHFDLDYKDANDKLMIPYGFVVPLKYTFSSLRQLNTNSDVRFEDDFGNVIGCDRRDDNGNLVVTKGKNDAGEEIIIDDGTGGIKLGKGTSIGAGTLYMTDSNGYAAKDSEGKYIPVTDSAGEPELGYVLNVRFFQIDEDDDDIKVETGLRQFVFAYNDHVTPEESAAFKQFFDGLKFDLKQAVMVEGLQYDTSIKPYKEYADGKDKLRDENGKVIGEISTGLKSMDFNTYAYYKQQQEGSSEKTEGMADETRQVNILIGGFKVTVPQVDNEKKNMDDYGKFTIKRLHDTPNTRDFTYTNNPNKLNGTDTSIVTLNDGVNGPNEFEPDDYKLEFKNRGNAENPDYRVVEITFTRPSMGKYELEVDDSVLTSYKVLINGEEVKKAVIDLKPVYDPDEKVWTYPEVEFELRAKRKAPDLKDLT